MRETLTALLQLQEIDRQIFRVQSELKRLPVEREAKKAEFERKKARIDELRREAQLLRVRIKELDDLATQSRQRMRKVEHEAASARQDMALLVAFQHEIRTLKKDIGAAEEEGVGLIDKADALDADVKSQSEALSADLELFAQFNANVEKEVAAARTKIAELEGQRRTRTHARVPEEALALYTRLLGAREGLAIADLEGRTCQGCFMEIPTNMVVRVNRGTELVQCPSCDRILHNPR